jgi:NAD(P)-dependent dehydrogenase (short-subunit alcohol dehydrogenase family)
VKEKIALVTGAGRGIGRAVSLALAGEGCSLLLVARSREGIEETARLAEEAGAPRAEAFPADLTRGESLDAVLERARDAWGRIDVLVQNAGVFRASPLAETSDEEWDDLLLLNLTVPFRLLKRALPLLDAAGGGHVFHIASVAGRQAFPGCSAYCASKHGLMGLTAVVREELRGSGTRVTAILPGAVDTPAWDDVPGAFDRGRMLRPEDVARAVIASLGDAPSAMTEEIVIRPRAGDL